MQRLILILTVTLIYTISANAQQGGPPGRFYRYTDENGTNVFVQDPNKIPPQYRDRAESITGSSSATKSKITKFSFRPGARLVVVNAMINGNLPVKLLADPNVTKSLIGPKLAETLGYKADSTGNEAEFTVAGEKVSLPVVKLESVELGSRRGINLYPGVAKEAEAPEYAGILGDDYFSQFTTAFVRESGRLTIEDKAPR